MVEEEKIDCIVEGCNGKMTSERKEWQDADGTLKRQRVWTCQKCGKVLNAGIISEPKFIKM